MCLNIAANYRYNPVHTYVIPVKLKENFSWHLSEISKNEEDQDLIDQFENRFGQYRTGGDINVKLYADIK